MLETMADMKRGIASGLTIRSATIADIPAMKALEANTGFAAHWSVDTYERFFCSNGLRRLILVLELGSAPVGFMVVLCVGTEWEIENIAIAGNMRRCGLGALLVRESLKRADEAGAEGVFLEVRESNYPARALYEKLDFVQTGKRAGYYSDPPEDAILYHFSFRQRETRDAGNNSKVIIGD